ncbi:hypothetical protein [Parapedobacter sp. 10938]|uniref:hypothetical protein n=1 Tax=Parapedobacter flavus TaxID=3110225 RepID=UPI002DBBEDBF|nr:hypothetical protein [Parapedobacter sp. 10938]MEC3878775.1 hypothetical protein [Parapedobacter sp. 10938]
MEYKARRIAMHHKPTYIMILLFAAMILCNSGRAQTNAQIDSLHKVVDRMFWTNSGRAFLDEADKSPQHFLFSIRFELDSNGMITNIKNSTNMHQVFDETLAAIRENIAIDIFAKAGYNNTQIIFPVFVFIHQLQTPINYGQTFLGIKGIWRYGVDDVAAPNAIIFPPIYRITSKSTVLFGDVEMNGHRIEDKLKKDLPSDNKNK